MAATPGHRLPSRVWTPLTATRYRRLAHPSDWELEKLQVSEHSQSRCLAMDIFYSSTISAFNRHVTILKQEQLVVNTIMDGITLLSIVKYLLIFDKRKVAGSIQDEIIGFFNWPNSSSRTMTLGSTQSLTEINARNLPAGKRRPALKFDNLTTICAPIAKEMWEPRRLVTLWVSTACYRDSFCYLYLICFAKPGLTEGLYIV
jgi:hypothetical protein